MRSDFVVVAAPLLDADLGVGAVSEPLQRQMFVPEFPVEGFVRTVLPGLARIDERRLNLGDLQPSQNRGSHELGAVVGPQMTGTAVDAHEAARAPR